MPVLVLAILVAASCAGPTAEDEERMDALREDRVVTTSPTVGTLDHDWHFTASNEFETTEIRQEWDVAPEDLDRFIRHYVAVATDAGWRLHDVTCSTFGTSVVGTRDHDGWRADLVVRAATGAGGADVLVSAHWSGNPEASGDHAPADLSRTCAGDLTGVS